MCGRPALGRLLGVLGGASRALRDLAVTAPVIRMDAARRLRRGQGHPQAWLSTVTSGHRLCLRDNRLDDSESVDRSASSEDRRRVGGATLACAALQ